MTPRVRTMRRQSLLLTVEEAAADLRVSRARMYDLIMTGQVDSLKIGASRRIRREALKEYVRRLTAEQGGGDTV